MRHPLHTLAEYIGAHRDEQREEHERDRARQRLIITTLMGGATLWTAVDAGRQGAWPWAAVVVAALLAACLAESVAALVACCCAVVAALPITCLVESDRALLALCCRPPIMVPSRELPAPVSP